MRELDVIDTPVEFGSVLGSAIGYAVLITAALIVLVFQNEPQLAITPPAPV